MCNSRPHGQQQYHVLSVLQTSGGKGGAAAEEARQLRDLDVVARQAAATLDALQTTADALDEVAEAAGAVERAKGAEDDQVSTNQNTRSHSTLKYMGWTKADALEEAAAAVECARSAEDDQICMLPQT